MNEAPKTAAGPRLPLEGNLDLTYRCNNRCRHCWLWEADQPESAARELTCDEIRTVVEEARALGCRRWNISGGEPMLRDDFAEIFDHVTSRCAAYSLNTNGTLITPAVARLMKRPGVKMVALYGATAAVHDHITNTPGSFAAALQGMAYLKEAGAGFVVQLVPLRDNWHEWAEMQELATSLSSQWRVGAAWLYLSACGSAARNAAIAAQRLTPADVVALDQSVLDDEAEGGSAAGCGAVNEGDDRLYRACIQVRRDFHVDPCGMMSFCGFVKDPLLRYDLRRGTFAEAWEQFIPSLADTVRGGPEYLDGCGACEIRGDCCWCDVYGYLEHGRHGARVEYLCAAARETRACREARRSTHRRSFEIAGITVRADSDLPIDESTFSPKFASFVVDGPGGDTITIRHHFEIPDLEHLDLGREVYRQAPWAIYRKDRSWIYVGISDGNDDGPPHRVAVFSDDHARAEIYSRPADEEVWRAGGLSTLTLFPTDQIMLARVLADHDGCYLHSGGVILDDRGLLFVGHSGAGKSTAMSLFEGHGEVLCDDRNIVRQHADGFRVYGTWSHGEVPIVSSASAPLRGIFFLRQASTNGIDLVTDLSSVRAELTGCLIRPLATADWWERMLDLIGALAATVPCYEMSFDKSGAIVPLVEELAGS